MSGNEINRREFLKYMGAGGVGAAALTGCDMPTTVTLEEGKEKVVSYLAPEEYVIPGRGVYFASTCQQCPAGCGVHGRVREGRVLKVEGNPDSVINGSGLCQMGQAGLQGHYNPDRINTPMVRKGGSLVEATWEEAWEAIRKNTSNLKSGRSAWFTGTVSGHQSVLLSAVRETYGAKHYAYEAINNAVGESVNEAVLGDATPRYRFDKAKAILSFGADFLGTWVSPVHFAKEYANKFRSGDRGVLIQVEPKMTLTGGNADQWVAIRPGTEGVLAMGIANVLIGKGKGDASRLPGSARSEISKYNVAKVTEVTGVSADSINRIAGYLSDRSPSLVLSGESANGHANGSQNAAAAMMLNVLLGNVGKTIVASASLPVKGVEATRGSSRALLDFAEAADQDKFDAVFFYGTNPVFTAPKHVGLTEKLAKVPFKVALSMFPDETTLSADVVLPLASQYEDWGTTVAPYQAEQAVMGVSQPLMRPLSSTTQGFGDILLGMLKGANVAPYTDFDDYYAYLRKATSSMPASLKGGRSDADFWATTLQSGLINMPTSAGSLSVKVGSLKQAAASTDSSYPMHLVPSARLGMWDGRHANIPWIQEAPDQISKVFWDSWAEIHPITAARLGVKEGDVIRVESDQGAVEAQVYIYKGVHPDVVAIPMGQGHEEHGRYAKGVGVNPLKILSAITDKDSGELATHATRVQISATGEGGDLPRQGGSEVQAGRRIVGTVTADVFRRVEGADHDVA